MSDEWKNDRLEAEIIRHEMELMRKAKIKKLMTAPASEKIQFIIQNSERKDWTTEDLMEELTKIQLDEGVTLSDINNELKKK